MSSVFTHIKDFPINSSIFNDRLSLKYSEKEAAGFCSTDAGSLRYSSRIN
jgi:hypothetical protein